MDASSIIKAAKRPERTVELCLRADLVAALEDAQRRIARVREAPRDSLGDDGGLGALRDELAAIKAEAKDHTIVFRFRALNRYELNALLAAQPPREGVRTDAQQGFNTDAVTYHLIRDCCYEPELGDDEWDALLGTEGEVGNGVLSPSQWDRLDSAVSSLNFARADVPF